MENPRDSTINTPGKTTFIQSVNQSISTNHLHKMTSG